MSALQIVGAIAVLVGAIVLFLWFRGSAPAAAEKGRFVSASSKKRFVKPTTLKDYTEDEVARHNTADDLWLIIKDKVYDVSTYVSDHPGGDSILNHPGRDNTAGFFGEQHGEAVFNLVEDYRIGQIASKKKE